MGDYISRAKAIFALSTITMYKGSIPYNTAVMRIKQLPSAQPEIIRCKDCKYNPNPPECGNAACVLFYGMTDQMGFCHHGERRERE